MFSTTSPNNSNHPYNKIYRSFLTGGTSSIIASSTIFLLAWLGFITLTPIMAYVAISLLAIGLLCFASLIITTFINYKNNQPRTQQTTVICPPYQPPRHLLVSRRVQSAPTSPIEAQPIATTPLRYLGRRPTIRRSSANDTKDHNPWRSPTALADPKDFNHNVEKMGIECGKKQGDIDARYKVVQPDGHKVFMNRTRDNLLISLRRKEINLEDLSSFISGASQGYRQGYDGAKKVPHFTP